MKNFLLLSVLLGNSLSVTAQVWEVLLETFLIDGFWYTMIESPEEPKWHETTFASYPYDLRENGLFLPPDLEGDQSRVNINLHFQNDESNISGIFGRIKYSPISLLTLETSRLQYFDSGKPDDTENVNLTSASLIYNRLRHHKIHAWWGIGGLWLDADENAGSFSFNAGANYFFKDPISLYGEAIFAGLNDEFAALVQARIQVHLRRYLFYGGYHHTNIGVINIGSWIIGGGVYF